MVVCRDNGDGNIGIGKAESLLMIASTDKYDKNRLIPMVLCTWRDMLDKFGSMQARVDSQFVGEAIAATQLTNRQ